MAKLPYKIELKYSSIKVGPGNGNCTKVRGQPRARLALLVLISLGIRTLCWR
jgi:hypothetical protein